MKKCTIAILLSLSLFLSLLSGCTNIDKPIYDTVFQEVTETYIAYREMAMVDWQEAVKTYCYYNGDEEGFNKALEGIQTTFYEIIRVQKYTDALWEIEFFFKDSFIPSGMYGVNYVALIDGEYRVCTNLRWVPDELLEGIEIEPYQIHGPDIIGSDENITGVIE